MNESDVTETDAAHPAARRRFGQPGREGGAPPDAVRPLRICIVGAGPRGLSVLERIGSRLGHGPDVPPPVRGRTVEVHLVDLHQPGCGAVWRTDQSRWLHMNTVACQVTVFGDRTVRCETPPRPGPTLYEWARSATEQVSAEVRAEALSLRPDSYPTRRLYGHYLRWAYTTVVDGLPPWMSVSHHAEQAVRLGGQGNMPRSVRFLSGGRLDDLDAVVLALGHSSGRSKQWSPSTSAAGDRSIHLPPGNPADAPVDEVKPGQPTLLLGLGLNFFDHLSLFCVARGGCFERAGGELRYRPSGNEPLLLAGSRRGVPHHARGEDHKGSSGRFEPALLTEAHASQLRRSTRLRGRPLDFATEIWPLIAAEAEAVYYSCLLGWPLPADTSPVEPADRLADPGLSFRGAYVRACPSERERMVSRAGLPPDQHWDWGALSDPLRGRRFRSLSLFNAWALHHLGADVDAAALGNLAGPVKAALDVLRDLRNQVRTLLDHGGLDGRSYATHVRGWYNPLSAFLSVGPPAWRVEQLGALIASGVVRLTGAGTRVDHDRHGGCWQVTSDSIPDWRGRVTALVDCWMPAFDAELSDDPLVRSMLHEGRCRPHALPHSGGAAAPTGGLDVTAGPLMLVDRNGRPDRRVFAFGVPTEGARWMTSAGIRPWSGSVTLTDADSIAGAILRLALDPDAAHVNSPNIPPSGPAGVAGHSRPRELQTTRAWDHEAIS